MAEHTNEEELAIEQTPGFKVGEKKTIDEYNKLGPFINAVFMFPPPFLHKPRSTRGSKPDPSHCFASWTPHISSEHLTNRPSTPTDEQDESLRKYKESLGLGSAAGKSIADPNDPRQVVMLSLGLEVQGRSDIIIDLRAPGAVDKLKEKPFTIKEGAQFRMKTAFRVQHQILSGMKYIQVVKKMGISNKTQEMIVSSGSAFGTGVAG